MLYIVSELFPLEEGVLHPMAIDDLVVLMAYRLSGAEDGVENVTYNSELYGP